MNARKRLTPDATRDEIVAAAGRLALRVGLSNITRDGVAQEADRSQGLISHHFTIDDLRVAVVEQAVAHNNAELVAEALCMRDGEAKAATRDAPEALLKKARQILLKR